MWRWMTGLGGLLACVLSVGVPAGMSWPVATTTHGGPDFARAAQTSALPMAAPARAPAIVPRQAQGVPGISVRIIQLPERFVAGAAPETITVTAAKSGDGDCLKIRWSLALRLQGLSVEQLRIDRIEETGSFPIDVQRVGDTARVIDEQLDPGTLCRNRTVTARYEINVANDVLAGRVTMLAEAYDSRLRLLAQATATRSVVAAAGRAEPTDAVENTPGAPSSTPEDGSAAGQEADTGPGAGADAGAGQSAPADLGADAAGDQNAASADQNGLPLAWFLIGGLMVFLGISLLLNVRWRRDRPAGQPDGDQPTEAAFPAPALSGYRTLSRPGRARGW